MTIAVGCRLRMARHVPLGASRPRPCPISLTEKASCRAGRLRLHGGSEPRSVSLEGPWRPYDVAPLRPGRSVISCLSVFALRVFPTSPASLPLAVSAQPAPGTRWRLQQGQCLARGARGRRSEVGADPETGRDIWMRGSQNALPGFTCWTRPQPLRRRGQGSEGLAPIRRKASHPSGQRQRVTDVAQLRRCPLLSRARALRPRRWYQPGLGSHAARQGGPPARSGLSQSLSLCPTR